MVRINITLLAFAATGMAATIQVRSAGDLDRIGTRSAPPIDTDLVKRQNATDDANTDGKITDLVNSLTDEQKAAAQKAQDLEKQEENDLTQDQKSKLKEIDDLIKQGKLDEADQKSDELEQSLSQDQKNQDQAVAQAFTDATNSLSADQKAELGQITGAGPDETQDAAPSGTASAQASSTPTA